MPEVRRTKAKLSRQQWRELQEKRQQELKRRLESLGSSSLSDVDAFAHFPKATEQQKDDFPHALASFYSTMLAGKTSKSADNYMQKVKMLMERFQLSLDAMVSEEFLEAVKKTQENQKVNNMISAGLKKFRDFMQERGSAPWEVKAAITIDERFRMDFRRWAKREPAPTGRSLLTAHFVKREVEPEPPAAVFAVSGAAKPEMKDEEAPAEAEPKRKARRKETQGKRKREANSEASPRKGSLMTKGFFKSPPPKVTEAPQETPEKAFAPKGPLKVPSPEQEKELGIFRVAIRDAVRTRQYNQAKELHGKLLARCKEIGCAVPPPKPPKAEAKPKSKNETPKVQEEGEEPADGISFAQGILQEKFPLLFPDDKKEEDDAEIIPTDQRWQSTRRKARHEDPEAEECQEEQTMKKALSNVKDASFEDIDRFPAVATTFRQWLQKSKKKIQEEEAETYVKVLHDLFAQDEKALDEMAKDDYFKAVAKEPPHTSTLKLFREFWVKNRDGPWCPVTRVERKAEVRVRLMHFVPEAWSIRVVPRAHKEDLVILTTPDGAKHFAEASKLPELPVLHSEEFAKERERKAAMSKLERERDEAERLAKAKRAEKLAKTKVRNDLTPTVKELMAGADAEQSLLDAVFRQHIGCSGCGRIASRAAENVRRGMQSGWASYDDVPDATEEEVQQYPRVLATFYQQGFPYMNGVRRLMELYKKKAWDMATPEFQQLVRMDPENAKCNGYLNSAILYLRKFRESGGFDNLMDISEMDPVKLQSTFTPDFERETNKEQENFDDLQVDVPLELVMADATDNWRAELREKFDDEGYLLEDVDARGQRPVALSMALLPNASDEEWSLWPRILAKYETYCKQESEEEKPIKREAEANDMFLAMKELLEEHGKSPEAMASPKCLKMVKSTYSGTNKDRAVALAKFAEFWAAHRDGEFPEPKVHALAAMKYKLIDRQLLEQAKRMAAEWKLPEGWSVKLAKDGRLIKVNGPCKEIYHSKEAALRAVEQKASRRAEEAKAAHQQMISAKEGCQQDGKEAVLRKIAQAVQEEDYGLAERLFTKLKSRLQVSSRKGDMPIVARSVKEVVGHRKGKGKGGGCKKHTLKIKASEALKVRKAHGLKHEQKQQVARSELTLRTGEWRLQGIRLPSGPVVPLDAGDELQGRRTHVVLVLVYVDEEVRERKRRQIIEEWGLDDTWQVTVRYRLTGHQVTAKRADGRVFLTKLDVACAKDTEAIEKFRPSAETRVKEIQELLTYLKEGQLWELEVQDLSTLSGLYRKDGECYKKVTCLIGSHHIEVKRADGGLWQFLDSAGQSVAESTLESPFANQIIRSGGATWDAKGDQISNEELSSRIAAELGRSFGPCCRFCQRSARSNVNEGSSKRPEARAKVEKGLRAEQKEALVDARLRELEERRSKAPRTLLEITRCMIGKLKSLSNLPTTLLQKQVLRIGTMCSGTDAPVLVARALERALKHEGSEMAIQHAFSVEFDAAKQEFLKANFPECPLLFRDATQMGRKRAFEVLSRKPQPIPGDLDILVAGFSCKDLSMMNSYRKTLEEMGQSGSTLRGVLDYVERYRPRLVLLENVWAIAKSNTSGFRQVDLVMEGLKARGYAAGYRLMNSCDYFLPQIRHRIWMWAIRVSDSSARSLEASQRLRQEAEQATLQVQARYNEILVALEEPCALHFEDYMLDDDHPKVRAHVQLMKSLQRKSVYTKKRGAKQDWLEKYDSHRTRNDYKYDRPYTAVRDAEFLQVLNEREKELLDLKCLDIMNEQGKDPRLVPMLWELSQSVERVPGVRVRRDRQNYATCILPGMLWHSSRHRWVLGIEKLALQGIFSEDLKDMDFPQKLLGDLAGNAFTTSVCAANLLAILCCSTMIGGACQ